MLKLSICYSTISIRQVERTVAELVPKYLDTNAIAVKTGGVAVATALLKEKWDHIMYTGNGCVPVL